MQLTDFDRFPNLVAMFLDRAQERGDHPMLAAKHGGAWVAIDWATAADQVCLLARSLRAIGLNAGDRVALVSENRPEWCIADLAIMAAGLVTVPLSLATTARKVAPESADAVAGNVYQLDVAPGMSAPFFCH